MNFIVTPRDIILGFWILGIPIAMLVCWLIDLKAPARDRLPWEALTLIAILWPLMLAVAACEKIRGGKAP